MNFQIKTFSNLFYFKKLFSIVDLRNNLDFTKNLDLRPRKKVRFLKRNDKMSLVTNFEALSLREGLLFKESV